MALLLILFMFLPHAVAADSAITASASGSAGEDGPGALWINPANIGFDPDPRFGFWARQPSFSMLPTSYAGIVGIGGLSIGYSSYGDGVNNNSALDYGNSLKINDSLNAGMGISWNFLHNEDAFTTYSVGLSYRPQPWVGMSMVMKNLGSGGKEDFAQATTVGLAVRPFGKLVMLGIDTSQFLPVYDELGTEITGKHLLLRGSMRLRLMRGLYTSASFDSEMTTMASAEFYFGRSGVGTLATASNPSSDTFTAGQDMMLTSFYNSTNENEAILTISNPVAHLRLNQSIPYESPTGLFAEPTGNWTETMLALDDAAESRRSSGILVELDGTPLSWAQAREVRQKLVTATTSQKSVVAYLHGTPTIKELYIASAANTIITNPASSLYITGISSQIIHFSGSLKKIGVEPQFVKRSEYKSAVEQYTHNDLSDPAKEQINDLLDDIYEEVTSAIAKGRGVTPSEVKLWVDSGPHTANQALKLGIVDELLHSDELQNIVDDRFNGAVLEPLAAPGFDHSPWEAPDQVAMITIEGAITSGQSLGGGLFGSITTGSATVVAQLEAVASNNNIKAVVIRVDSPGGSAYASEEIHRAIEMVKAGGKPVIVSMGGVAASGGYYVAAGADAIWAEPTTVTGSIGVFAGKFSMTGLFEKIGLGTTTIHRGTNAGIMGATAWSESEKARMEDMVNDTYLLFKTRVSEGRSLSLKEVEKVARGRVWSGKHAQEVGLVDNLGGVTEAIQEAKKRAGISNNVDVEVVYFGARSGGLGALSSFISTHLVQPTSTDLALETFVEKTGLAQNEASGLFWLLSSNDEPVTLCSPWIVEIKP